MVTVRRKIGRGSALNLPSIRCLLFSPKIFPAVAFLLGVGVRTFPELVAGQYPVGYDTVTGYLTTMLTNDIFSHGLSNLIRAPNLFFIIQQLTFEGFRNPLLTLKILPVAIFGLFTLSIFVYSSRALALSPNWALTAACLSSLSWLSLRLSWDLQQNMLGLTFGILSLSTLSLRNSLIRSAVIPLTLLAVWTHQLVAVFVIGALFARIAYSHLRLSYLEREPAVAVLLASPLLLYESFNPAGSLWIPGFSSDSGFAFTDIVGGLLYFLLCSLPLLVPTLFVKRHTWRTMPAELPMWVIMVVGFALVGPLAGFQTVWPYRVWLMMAFPIPLFATLGLIGAKRLLARRIDTSYPILGAIAVWTLLFLSVSPSLIPFNTMLGVANYGPTGYQQNVVPVSQVPDLVTELRVGESLAVASNQVFVVPQQFWGLALANGVNSSLVLEGNTVGSWLNNSSIADVSKGSAVNRPYLTIWWIRPDGWYGVYVLPNDFRSIVTGQYFAVYNCTEVLGQ